MKKSVKIIILLIATITLFSCGESVKHNNPKMYFVSYTDKNGEDIYFDSNDVTYMYITPTHENEFNSTQPKYVYFKTNDATPENIIGKTIDVMIADKLEDFNNEKSFKCNVEAFDYVKKGMFDDKVYKLTGTFNTDDYKNGKLCLQVYM